VSEPMRVTDCLECSQWRETRAVERCQRCRCVDECFWCPSAVVPTQSVVASSVIYTVTTSSWHNCCCWVTAMLQHCCNCTF